VHTISAEERVLASRLAEWREEVATTINKPRNFIMRDDAILDLVLMARRAHKYFPVHRAGVNTMHLSRAGPAAATEAIRDAAPHAAPSRGAAVWQGPAAGRPSAAHLVLVMRHRG
jgi:ribonuclease D